MSIISGLEAMAIYTIDELEALAAIELLCPPAKKYIYIKPIQIPIDPIKKEHAQRSLELEREKLATFIKKSMTLEELSPERLRHLSKRLMALQRKPNLVFEKIPYFPAVKLRRFPKIQTCSNDVQFQAR
jgi:hypothetical protein